MKINSGLRNNKRILFIIVSVFLLITIVCFYYVIKNFRPGSAQHTYPLDEKVQADVCEKLKLEVSNSLCDSKEDVFGPDFYKVIEEIVMPEGAPPSTYEMVFGLIGEYELFCTESVKSVDEGKYYCKYNFQGNEVFGLFISFLPTDEVDYLYNVDINLD